MSDPLRDDIEALAKRYEAGIAWITERDPRGAFYFMYESGIRPHHPMPAQTEERRADYTAYCHALEVWRALDRKLHRMELAAAKAAAVPA